MEANQVDWKAVVQLGSIALGAILFGFWKAYWGWRAEHAVEHTKEDIVQKSVGAAFVDRSASADLARIADNSDKLVGFALREEERDREKELLEKLEEKLRKERSLQQRLPDVD